MSKLCKPLRTTTKFHAFSGSDSEEISTGLWYCKQRNLWWKDGTVYDERSANHNGIIGMGASLSQLIRKSNVH